MSYTSPLAIATASLLTPAYPPALEAYWLRQAQRETRALSDRDAIQRLLPDIRRLADRFTTARPSLPPPAKTPGEGTPPSSVPSAPAASPQPRPPADAASAAVPAAPVAAPAPAASSDPIYLRTACHAIAYSLYFAPLTHARMNLVLPELPLRAPDPRRPYRILDLGAGTGAAAWPALARAAAAGHAALSLDVCDTSRAALRALHETFLALRPSAFPTALLRTHLTSARDLDLPPHAYDLVILHYVLNELPPDEQLALLEHAARFLAPDGILLLCEPLVRAVGDRLRAWRDYAMDTLHLHLLAPCPHELACPLREPCHAVRTFPLPRTLQILATALHRDLRHLAFTFLALTPAPAAAPTSDTAPLAARLVASPTFAKGQTLCPACLPDGSFARLQLLHRDLPAAVRKSLRALERGQRLLLADATPLGTPPLRRAHLSTSPVVPTKGSLP